MRRVSLVLGIALLFLAWTVAASRTGMTGHMTAHMLSVAVAAPLVAWGISGTRLDPAARWPGIVTPLPMSVVELFAVWGWHVPAARGLASSGAMGLLLEQITFFVAGLLLWSACLGSRDARNSARRAAGVGALLLTTMHMTLLGVLITLAPRLLYPHHAHGVAGMSAMQDQQLGGVVMLVIGAGSYLAGGLLLLGRMLQDRATGAARP